MFRRSTYSNFLTIFLRNRWTTLKRFPFFHLCSSFGKTKNSKSKVFCIRTRKRIAAVPKEEPEEIDDSFEWPWIRKSASSNEPNFSLCLVKNKQTIKNSGSLQFAWAVNFKTRNYLKKNITNDGKWTLRASSYRSATIATILIKRRQQLAIWRRRHISRSLFESSIPSHPLIMLYVILFRQVNIQEVSSISPSSTRPSPSTCHICGEKASGHHYQVSIL